MAMPPVSDPHPPNYNLRGKDFVWILFYAGAFPIVLFMGFMLRVCYERIFGVPLPDVEMGQQSDPPKPITSAAGKVVEYEGKSDGQGSGECVICLEGFKRGDSCRVLSACQHLYHQSCVDRWLQQNSNCPICRGSVYDYHGDGDGGA